ncbi:MAG: diguanylate cyclase [Pirellulaceae bacterium]|jgi:diguanylate cyclase|nr:diguanylate cyclase [Pirellulaceae bacterium]MDP7019801.1 diguanylate cyclase [Pirellulaceae bacterium]
MGSLIIDVLLVGLAAAIGGGAAWFLRGGDPPEPEIDPELEEELALTQQDLKRAQSKLEEARQNATSSQGEHDELKDELAKAQQAAATARDETADVNSALEGKTGECDYLRDEIEKMRLEAESYKSAITELHSVAAQMAEDVGEHSRSVAQISNDLDGESNADVVVEVVKKLVSANGKMAEQLESAEQELEKQKEEIASHVHEARTDALTGLNNRRAFDDEMEKCEKAFVEHGRPSCVMVIDVDHFKKFNDTYGHQAGDEVLKGVARVLNENLPENEIVCRYGGEEFCIIFPGSDIEAAIPAAERSRAAIGSAVFSHEGTELRVTASGGLAEFRKGEPYEPLVKRADDSLYVCKEAGRDCGHWHDGEQSIPMTERLLNPPAAEIPADDSAAAKEQDEVAETVVESVDEPPQQATKDKLTGLSTKAAFDEDLDRRLAEWRRGGPAISVVLAKVDGFGDLETDQGAAAGDTVIRACAQFLRATMRDMDHVARYDRDEFSMLLPTANLEDADVVAERTRQAIELCRLPGEGAPLQFTVSVGSVEAIKGDDTGELMGRVRQCVAAGHEEGGNCCKSQTDLGIEPALDEADAEG